MAKPWDVSGLLCHLSVKQRVAGNPESVLATWTCDLKFLADLVAGRQPPPPTSSPPAKVEFSLGLMLFQARSVVQVQGSLNAIES